MEKPYEALKGNAKWWHFFQNVILNDDYVLIDLREELEIHRDGFLANSKNVPFAQISDYLLKEKEKLESKKILICMFPIVPNLCKKIFKHLFMEDLEVSSWPNINQTALEEKDITLPIQINGKLIKLAAITPAWSTGFLRGFQILRESHEARNRTK